MNAGRDLPVVLFEPVDKIKFVYEFIARHRLAALCTVDERGRPEAAVVEVSALDGLEVIFDTYAIFRKYRNLSVNPRVALVIGWDDDVTLQYEGIACELIESELDRCRSVHLEKFPHAVKFEEFAGMKYFKIVPTWIRYTDLETFPWKRFEIAFNNNQPD